MPRHYSNWLKAYMQFTASSESPDGFHLWTGVATIAGALRRRVWIDQCHFQWTPNFYVVLVGPPGVAAKSTSIRSGIGLLEKVPEVIFGPQSMTWQALTQALKNSTQVVEIPGLPEAEVMSCLTIGVSELGTFLQADNKELIDFLVDMWDGQKITWRRQTKGEGEVCVHNPWINLIACTTPAWLKDNFPDVLIGGGLTSRMVFVYAEQKRHFVAYPADVVEPNAFNQTKSNLIEDLIQISQLCGEYKLTADAKVWGSAWYEKHWSTAAPDHISGERFAGYRARKQTHLHKLAIILAAAKRSTLTIEVEDLQEADLMLSAMELDMSKVFASIGVQEMASYAIEIRDLVKTMREVNYKRLWQLCFNRFDEDTFVKAIKANISAGNMKITDRDTKDGKAKYVVWTGKLL